MTLSQLHGAADELVADRFVRQVPAVVTPLLEATRLQWAAAATIRAVVLGFPLLRPPSLLVAVAAW